MGRPKINLNDKEEKIAKSLLVKLITKEGGRIGNITLLDRFISNLNGKLGQNFGNEVYWQVRNSLIEDGKLERGRGKGGAVSLVERRQTTAATRGKRFRRESHIYEPFHNTIQKDWVQEHGIVDYASEISAHKGSKDTGGKWTRPDVTLVSVGKYELIPGKTIEITTFEIKPVNKLGIEGVYETASHSAYANKSYLAIHLPTSPDREGLQDVLDRLEKECVRFGIGLILFEDPSSWQTFEVVVEAQHKTPEPG